MAVPERVDEMWRAVLTSRVVAARPVIDTAEQNLMAVLNENRYEKGGFVLHMLRAALGDSAFFRGLHRYYDRYRNGNALTDDFRRELEAASGTPLGWFFDQWLRRPGFPELTTSWTYDAAAKRVTLSITQAARFGSYRFPLTVDIRTAAGGRVFAHGRLRREEVARQHRDAPGGAARPGAACGRDVDRKGGVEVRWVGLS